MKILALGFDIFTGAATDQSGHIWNPASEIARWMSWLNDDIENVTVEVSPAGVDQAMDIVWQHAPAQIIALGCARGKDLRIEDRAYNPDGSEVFSFRDKDFDVETLKELSPNFPYNIKPGTTAGGFMCGQLAKKLWDIDPINYHFWHVPQDLERPHLMINGEYNINSWTYQTAIAITKFLKYDHQGLPPRG
jgi:hypothetical protein